MLNQEKWSLYNTADAAKFVGMKRTPFANLCRKLGWPKTVTGTDVDRRFTEQALIDWVKKLNKISNPAEQEHAIEDTDTETELSKPDSRTNCHSDTTMLEFIDAELDCVDIGEESVEHLESRWRTFCLEAGRDFGPTSDFIERLGKHFPVYSVGHRIRVAGVRLKRRESVVVDYYDAAILESPAYLTATHAAKLLDVTRYELRKWRDLGIGPWCLNVFNPRLSAGHMYLYSRADLEDYKRKFEKHPQPEATQGESISPDGADTAEHTEEPEAVAAAPGETQGSSEKIVGLGRLLLSLESKLDDMRHAQTDLKSNLDSLIAALRGLS